MLQALQEQVPDAILLDMDMPGMSGVEAIQSIKKLSPSTPVLMLSICPDQEAMEHSLAAGAAGYLLKRDPPAKIAAAIRMAKKAKCQSLSVATDVTAGNIWPLG